MYFQLHELLRWLGLTAFEVFTALSCFLVFTILVTLKVEGILSAGTSWWVVFSPLFVSDALNGYFCVIVFIRMYIEVGKMTVSAGTSPHSCTFSPGILQVCTRQGPLESLHAVHVVSVQVPPLPEVQQRPHDRLL